MKKRNIEFLAKKAKEKKVSNSLKGLEIGQGVIIGNTRDIHCFNINDTVNVEIEDNGRWASCHRLRDNYQQFVRVEDVLIKE
ncbi:hypothetical protein ACR3AM_005461 [Bacillus thuringiensis]